MLNRSLSPAVLRAAFTLPIAAVASIALLAAPAQPQPAEDTPAFQADRSIEGVFPYPDSDFTLINHRGLSPDFPENTLAAFANSVSLGVDAIEIDLRPTKDGEIVILHDATVDRTTDGSGPVNELTLDEVKSLDAGGYVSPEFAGQRIPTYEESLEAVKGTGVHLLLDIKDSSQVAEIVRLTEAHDMAGEVIVGPRTVQALKEFMALNPDLLTLGFIGTPADADAFIDAGVDYIRLWPNWITESRGDAACQTDYAVRVEAYENGDLDHPGSASCLVEHVVSQDTPVWSTANDQPYEDMDELFGLGVTGILSDLPAVLGQLIDDIDQSRVVVAGSQISELKTATKGLQPVTAHLARADKYMSKGDIAKACGALDHVIKGTDSTSIPADTADEYVFAASRIKATLACSQF